MIFTIILLVCTLSLRLLQLLAKATELETLANWDAQFENSGAVALSNQNQANRTALSAEAWQNSQRTAELATSIISHQVSAAATLLAEDLPSEERYAFNSELTWQKQLALGFRPWNGLSEADLEVLKTIAAECPLTDDNGVFRARALLAFLNEIDVIYTEEDCRKGKEDAKRNTQGGKTGEDQSSFVSTQVLTVSPNPSSQRQIQVSCPMVEVGTQLLLKSTQGQVLQAWSLAPQQIGLTIDLKDLPTGLYFLQWSSGEEILTTKLILQ